MARIVEIATMTLKEGVRVEDFTAADLEMEKGHVRKQPGVISRQVAVNGRQWLAIIHWESADAAQASMNSFISAPATQRFMGMIDASTLQSHRYDVVRGKHSRHARQRGS